MVALKMLLSGPHATAAERARFRTEAEAVARLQHPNIVQIYEVGDAGAVPDSLAGIEFVGGGNLKGLLRGMPQPARSSAELLETLARAVQYAHEYGVVHRDLKPANILLANGDRESANGCPPGGTGPTLAGMPKITDFGLAKQFRAEALTAGAVTASGAILGSPCYMAPEQALGKQGNVGPAADIYALGAILYEMLSGRPPFQGETALDTLQQLKVQEPVPPSRLVPKLPRDLETICLKCLEKEPARRYATAADLADDLHRFQTNAPITARPVGSLERSCRWSRRNPGWAAMLAAVATLVLVIVVGTWTGVVRLQEALETSETNLDRTKPPKRNLQKQFRGRAGRTGAGELPRPAHGPTFRNAPAGAGGERADAIWASPRHFDALGNIAVAGLALSDLYPAVKWPGFPAGSKYVAFDDSLSLYARGDARGNCAICRLEEAKEIVLHRLPGLGEPAATSLHV